MVVGVCRVTLMIPESHSLKEKRMVLRRVKDRVTNKFNCAIAEVGEAGKWQSAALGFVVVSNDHRFTQSMVHKILNFIEGEAKVASDEQDYINYGDEDFDAGGGAHWEPDE